MFVFDKLWLRYHLARVRLAIRLVYKFVTFSESSLEIGEKKEINKNAMREELLLNQNLDGYLLFQGICLFDMSSLLDDCK